MPSWETTTHDTSAAATCTYPQFWCPRAQMGMTPLHFAAACGRQYTWEPPNYDGATAANISRLLMRHGARKHPKDKVRAQVMKPRFECVQVVFKTLHTGPAQP